MKKRYHTSLIMLYRCGALPSEVTKKIPKTTLYAWKKRDMAPIVGADYAQLLDENTELLQTLFQYEKLLNASKVLIRVFKLYQSTLLSFKKGKQRLLERRDEVKEVMWCMLKISVFKMQRNRRS